MNWGGFTHLERGGVPLVCIIRGELLHRRRLLGNILIDGDITDDVEIEVEKIKDGYDKGTGSTGVLSWWNTHRDGFQLFDFSRWGGVFFFWVLYVALWIPYLSALAKLDQE